MLRIVSSVSRPTSAGLLGKASAHAGRRGFASSGVRSADITLTVNGKEVTVPQGSALIQACEAAGAAVPRFCYHDRLAIAGNCRMCLVEVERSPKPVASCAMPAMPGSKVFTDTPLVKEAREGVMEFLLSNHPLDCPICDQGGECDLQDQSMRYGSDRSRFHEIAGKRAVSDKPLGPLIKTSMNRCIQCTRCVRFANEVAGVEELGTSGRGNDMQIGTYVEGIAFESELSGNVIDLCPVGALTSRPYAFTARPWELKNTESIDISDALGSNIRIDSRGVQVMRIQPRTNDDINEEWISDKARYSYDGLRTQRLTTPLIRSGDRFVPATWEQAFAAIKNGLEASGAKGDEIQGVAGALADTESLLLLRELVHTLGSENLTLDSTTSSGFADVRANYTLNTTIPLLAEADALLLVGTNPRTEAAVLNSRLRQAWLKGGLDVGLVGERVDTTYAYTHVGETPQAVLDFLAGKGPQAGGEFAKKWAKAQRPVILVGSAVGQGEVYEAVARYVKGQGERFVRGDWNGFAVLQRHASHTAAYDLNFLPTSSAAKTTPKFVYLLNADSSSLTSSSSSSTNIPEGAFVVYQGHHGDVGAGLADVVLPGAAYTEKSATWVNTEGRAQVGRAAVGPPGGAREDWKVLRALSEVLGHPLPYDDILAVRDRMWEIAPSLVRYDVLEGTSVEVARLGLEALAKGSAGKTSSQALGENFRKPIENFYQTDVISRASKTMAECTRAFVPEAAKEVAGDDRRASYA